MIDPSALRPVLPGTEHVDRRLEQILRRDSSNVGTSASMERLMLMLTRSCDLRCSYCFVALTEEGWQEPHAGHADPAVFAGPIPVAPRGDMSEATSRAAVDLLVRSARPQLGIQMFGGEPTRRWDQVVDVVRYAWAHPERRHRPIEFLFTTNGVNLTPERVAQLADFPVTWQFSLDGDAKGSRFRRGHLLAHDEAVARMQASVAILNASGARWFMNATLPPAAAGDVLARYRFAREVGVPALQMNYATGMRWTDAQVETYLVGLQEMLLDHARSPEGLDLLNWRNGADPAPLCADVIVDVDGTVYQCGALFHEKRFPQLKRVYRRAHLDDAPSFEGLRMSLSTLWATTTDGLADEPDELRIFEQGMRLGAAVDLVVQLTRRRLGIRGGGPGM
jgi:sulfatase maturation enzyme AslB (radical SAM superfamily)